MNSVYEAMTDAVFIADIETKKLLFCNSQAETMTGRSRDELIGMQAEDLHPTQFAEPIRQVFEESKVRLPSVEDSEVLTASGRRIPVFISTSFIRFEGRGALLGIFRDISSWNEADLERRRLWAAIEQLSEAVLITDAEASIIYANHAFFRMTGYGEEEVIGMIPGFLNSGEQNQETVEEMWKTLRAGRKWKGEFVNRKKDGTHYIDETAISPVFDRGGELVNYVSVKRDVTGRKAEEDRRRLEREEMEDVVELRLQELREAYDTITLQEKMASLGRLTAGIAHELNNPLQLVRMNADILAYQIREMKSLFSSYRDYIMERSCPDATSSLPEDLQRLEEESDFDTRDEEMRKAYEVLMNGVQRMERIISNVQKTFSIEKTSEQQEWDLNIGIREIVEILYNEYKYGTKVEVYSEGVLPLMCNRQEIQQVLISLMSNAFEAIRSIGKSTGTGSGEIVIRSWSGEETVSFSISDNSSGIGPEERKKVFEPFYTTRSQKSNTGFGLSLVYEIVVNRHGGTIAFENSESGGTLVTVSLPRGV
ncbi:MAG: PAS domain S-box protein [Spirochaetaceae bacterium]|nr:PAS domain S-box protein [Spirochaetaceae bacterium]MCF7947161.1 PAS domain S-box protein [Spirochaetia bacterium]MCF7950026.1 PAS domain S-box protein [Spirochaetaceae bacterium]